MEIQIRCVSSEVNDNVLEKNRIENGWIERDPSDTKWKETVQVVRFL